MNEASPLSSSALHDHQILEKDRRRCRCPCRPFPVCRGPLSTRVCRSCRKRRDLQCRRTRKPSCRRSPASKPHKNSCGDDCRKACLPRQSACQRILPVSRSRQITLKVCLRSAPMLSGCRNSLSPQHVLHGLGAGNLFALDCGRQEDLCCPRRSATNVRGRRSAVFHLMFLVGLQSAGRFFSFEMPEPSGPRHCGQFAAACAFRRSKAETCECQ